MSNNDDEWNDPPAITDDEPAGEHPPVGGYLLVLLAVLYSGLMLWREEYVLMLAALLAGMALYLGIIVVAAVRERGDAGA